MAKLPYTKLGLKINTDVATVDCGDCNLVEVKQYLPIEEKNKIISNIVNSSLTDAGYYNIALIEMNMTMEIIYNYTNISFTDKQKENLPKLYDAIISSGLYEDIMKVFNGSEYNWIRNIVYSTIEKLYEYKNSAYAIMDAISEDYKNLDLNADEIKNKIANGENVEFLKQVLTKLG